MSNNNQPVYTNYHYYRQQPVRQPKPEPTESKKPRNSGSKGPMRKLLSLIIILVILGVGAGVYSHDHKTSVKQVISKAIHHTATAPAPQPEDLISATALANMGSSINGIISNNSNIDMSVSLIDLNTGQSQHYGDTSSFTAASTTKVITAAYFLHQVEAGQQTLSETIDGNSAEYEIQQMIVISDDDAWEDLNNTLGYPQLQAYADSLGLNSFQAMPNTVTSSDMANIMAKLYEGKLLNSSDTQLLLGYLKQANYRQYIVPAVPSSDTIYHKIGLYEDNVNDEAIITNGSKAFVIVIFTNGNGAYNWPARAQIMQQITKVALSTYF